MTDRQCPSCGGFCKKSGCERREALEAEPTWTRPVEYTPPHMGRKPLTDEQRIQIMERLGITVYGPAAEAVEALIQEVEAAHGITAHTIEHDPAKIRAAFEEDDFQAGAV